MFRLNKMTDYAVVMMADMARRDDGVCTAATLAESTAIPLPTVAKLLKALAQAGLARSQRGAAGGYRLTRSAEEINVAEIVGAIEGPIALAACVDTSKEHCSVEALCAMRGNWDKVNRAVLAALRQVTLAEMMPRPFDFFAPPAATSDGAGGERRRQRS